jgi:hypothetical protein
MGSGHAKLDLPGMMQGIRIPGALDVEDMRTSKCFSLSAVLSSRLARPRTSNPSTQPCSSPDIFMRAEDGAAAQDNVRRRDWKTDAALLQTLFESAKQAGAVKDTSTEGP